MTVQNKEPFPYKEADTAIALSAGGRAEGFVADQIMPYAQVNERNFTYTEYSFADELQMVDDTISEKGQPNEVEYSGTKKEAGVVDRGLKNTYSNEQVASMPGRNPLGNRITKLTNVVLRNREKRVCDIVRDPNNAALVESLPVGSRIGDDGVKSITIIEDLKLSMLFRANSIVMSETVASRWRRAPDVISAYNMNLGTDGMVPEDFLRQYLMMDNLIIGKAIANKAEKGMPAQVDGVWKNDFMSLAYINPSASVASLQDDITFGLTARWHGPGVARNGRVAGRKMIDAGLHGGWEVRSGESTKEVVLSKDCLAIIQNPISGLS